MDIHVDFSNTFLLIPQLLIFTYTHHFAQLQLIVFFFSILFTFVVEVFHQIIFELTMYYIFAIKTLYLHHH